MPGIVHITSPINQRLLAAIEAHPDITAHELAEVACCSYRTLRKAAYLLALRQAGLIHVGRWTRSGVTVGDGSRRSGPPVEHYRIGPGPDAPRPRPISKAARCKLWRKTPAGRAYYARMLTRRFGIGAIDPVLAAMTSTTRRPELAR